VKALLEDGGRVVTIVASPVELALHVVQNFRPAQQAHRNGETIEVRLPADAVAALNAQLVQAGVRVHALVPKRSLEDYFLRITEGTSAIE
jgi:hypothetical protein